MIKNKKLLACSMISAFNIAIVCFDSIGAHAGEMDVKLGGSLGVQAFTLKQKDDFTYSTPGDFNSGRLAQSGVVEDGLIIGGLEAAEGAIKYGAKFKLNANTSPNKTGNPYFAKNAWIYVESNYGKLEFGSNSEASGLIKISAVNLGKGTGGIDGDYINFIQKYDLQGNEIADAFIIGGYGPFGHDVSGRANKVTYITQKLCKDKLVFGISYIPHSGMIGTTVDMLSLKRNTGYGYKNIIDASAAYENHLGELGFGASLSWQFGSAKDNPTPRHNMNYWEIGAKFKYAALDVAMSYGDWGKSGAMKNLLPNLKYNGKFWTVGASYKYKNIDASLTYLDSKRASIAGTGECISGYRKMRAISTSIEIDGINGFKPYIECTNFRTTAPDVALSNKGTLYMVGLSVKM